MPAALQNQSPVDDNVLNFERVLAGFLEARLITNRGGIEYSDISSHAFFDPATVTNAHLGGIHLRNLVDCLRSSKYLKFRNIAS